MPGRIKPALPVEGRMLIGIAGPQNSGKTTSALLLATGITKVTGGKICMIDTENGRALKYARNFKFNHLPLEPPFGPDRYDEAVEEAEQAGYGAGDVIIIDSMSHEHEGPGGVLELHEQWLDKKAGDDYKKRDKLSMLAWNFAKSGRKRFITFRLQRSKAHIILCFRAKEKLKPVPGKEPQHMGLQPIGGDEYFFEVEVALILPEGAQGKPDWSEKAARVNEYGDGPLKRLLHGTMQISEQTGRGIAELMRAGTPATTPATTTAVTSGQATEIKQSVAVATDGGDPIKLLAERLRGYINAAKDAGDLDALINIDYAADMLKIKDASPTAHAFLLGAYDKKMKSFTEQG